MYRVKMMSNWYLSRSLFISNITHNMCIKGAGEGGTLIKRHWSLNTWIRSSVDLKEQQKCCPLTFDFYFRRKFFWVFFTCKSFFSSPDPQGQGHVRYCHHLASVVRPLSFSYFNLLLWNNWAKWNQAWQKASI